MNLSSIAFCSNWCIWLHCTFVLFLLKLCILLQSTAARWAVPPVPGQNGCGDGIMIDATLNAHSHCFSHRPPINNWCTPDTFGAVGKQDVKSIIIFIADDSLILRVYKNSTQMPKRHIQDFVEANVYIFFCGKCLR